MALLKGVIAGEAIGADEMGRYLAPEQRALLLARLTDEVTGRTAAIVEEARTTAASLLREAEAEAEAIRTRAQEEGFAAGHTAGYAAGEAAGLAAAEPLAALLTEAVTGADAARRLILEGMEEEVLGLALQAAERVVGAAAESHRDLAARTVREGLRAAPGRVLRVRVNPADLESVSTSLVAVDDTLAIHPDGTVEIGGCIIHVEGGTVDLRLSTQMQSVAALLQGETA